MNKPIELENRYAARNYLPLPVVLTRGEGVWTVERIDLVPKEMSKMRATG